MTKNEKIIVEAEVVNSGSASTSYKSHTTYTQKPSDSALVGAWILGVIAVFLSLIPIIGLGVAFVALLANLPKKIPPILPIIAIVIGSVSTGIFVFFWLVLKAIF